MKNLLVFAIVLTTLVLAACSGNDSKSYDESLSPATSTKPVTPLTIADTLLSDTATLRAANTTLTAPAVSSPAITSPVKTTTTYTNATTSTKAGVNPAHGQPGHRCDIAVGATLSTPVTASKPQVQTMTTNTTPAPVSTPSILNTTGSGKLNPPHGQPGHDCAVEVGKPLKN